MIHGYICPNVPTYRVLSILALLGVLISIVPRCIDRKLDICASMLVLSVLVAFGLHLLLILILDKTQPHYIYRCVNSSNL